MSAATSRSILGQRGGSVVYGFDAPNRVIVARGASAGQHIDIDIDVFAMNGPISTSPENFVWVRSATLDFYKPERARVARRVRSDVIRLERDVDAIVPSDAQLEKVAGGFPFTEGPVWAHEGYLLFSSPDLNTIFRWTPDGHLVIDRRICGGDLSLARTREWPEEMRLTIRRRIAQAWSAAELLRVTMDLAQVDSGLVTERMTGRQP